MWGNFCGIHKSVHPIQIPFLTNISIISCGYDHLGLITNEKELFLYGRNNKGQCAVSHSVSKQSGDLVRTPTLVTFDRFANDSDYDEINTDYPSNYMKSDMRFSSVHCGKQFTFAITDDRLSLFASGVNDNGQIGLGMRTLDRFKMYRVPLPKGTIDNIYSGAQHVFVKLTDGRLFAFGNNNFGQLATGDLYNELFPKYIETKDNVRSVSCGMGHTAFLLEDGRILTVGRGLEGQLGYKSKQNMKPQEVKIPGEDKFDYISCGYSHTVAVSNKGNVYTWGNGLISDNVAYGGLSPIRTYIPKPDEHVPKLLLSIQDYESCDGKLLLSSGGYFCMLYYPTIGVCAHGIGHDGQLGIGNRGEITDKFVKIDHPSGELIQLECGFNWTASLIR